MAIFVNSAIPGDNVYKTQSISPKKEGFVGEGQKLKTLYDEYCKNLGGYQMVNGEWRHVHTVLHSDKQVATMLLEINKRLRSLGILPSSG